MEHEFKVGVITQTHGIKGEVKVFPTTDDPGRFKKGLKLILRSPKEDLDVSIEAVKFFKQLVILKFEGYDSINDIERFRRSELFVTRENAVKLKKDEYYIADLIGLSVLDENGDRLGILREVIPTGANDVYSVNMEDGRELLIPAIKECILSVDIEKETIVVHLLPGLLD